MKRGGPFDQARFAARRRTAAAPSSSTQANRPYSPSIDAGSAAAGAYKEIVNACTASGVVPLLAVMVSAYAPAAVGTPEKLPVPSPLSTNATPGGSATASATAIAGVGAAVVVTRNVDGTPSGKPTAAALVIAGASVPTRLPATNERAGPQSQHSP